MNLAVTVRPPAVAGAFYPADAAALRLEIARCLTPAAVLPSVQLPASAVAGAAARGRLKALIVPHAGYVYSGQTAGRAYAEAAEPLFQRIGRGRSAGEGHTRLV